MQNMIVFESSLNWTAYFPSVLYVTEFARNFSVKHFNTFHSCVLFVLCIFKTAFYIQEASKQNELCMIYIFYLKQYTPWKMSLKALSINQSMLYVQYEVDK